MHGINNNSYILDSNLSKNGEWNSIKQTFHDLLCKIGCPIMSDRWFFLLQLHPKINPGCTTNSKSIFIVYNGRY